MKTKRGSGACEGRLQGVALGSPVREGPPPPGGEPGASFQGMLVWLPASFKPFFHLVECSSPLTRLPALPLLCHSRLQSCSNPFLNEILSLKLSSASHAIMSKSQSAHSGSEALCSPVPFFPLWLHLRLLSCLLLCLTTVTSSRSPEHIKHASTSLPDTAWLIPYSGSWLLRQGFLGPHQDFKICWEDS